MIVVMVSDVEELNSKFASDKAKVREEGLKTLQGYLNCTGEVSLWTLLDQETAALDQNRIRSASWPGVLHALCTCIDIEVAASKKKAPKVLLAKTLRSFILKADDSSRAGQNLNLLRKAKKLFQHVVDIVGRVPSFIPEYNNVLCQLLSVFEYRVRMGKKIYADLVHFYLEKAKDISQNTAMEASSTREEAFRNISTLLCLLQHPPGDLPEILLKNITQDFIQIFSKLRDEGRIAKKLLTALNSFITGNGLNIGDDAGNIHNSLKPFMVRIWLTTRDKELKDGLVLYVRAQLNLRYILFRDASEEISILLDLVEKDLDQTGVSMGLHRLDIGREDKAGFVSKAMRSFFELAAVVLFEATQSKGFKSSDAGKRRRKADVAIVIKERLMEGKFMWGGAVCLLIRRFGSKLPLALILDWLEGLAASLDRILLDGINSRNFEGSIWTLRSLQELALLWGQTLQLVEKGGMQPSFPEIAKGESIWKAVWNALLHWLPLLSNVQVMVEETFRLLATLSAASLIPAASIPQDFWDFHRFTESPSGNLLYFIASVFVAPNSPMLNGELETRKKLLDWCLSSLNALDVHRTRFIFGEQLSPRLLATSLLSLAFGVIPGTSSIYEHLATLRKELSWPCCDREPYLEPDELEQAQEAELAALDRSDGLLVAEECVSHQEIRYSGASINQLPRSSTEALLRRMADGFLKNLVLATDPTQSFTLSQLLHLNTILANCIQAVECATERWVQPPSDWFCKGAMWEGLANVLERGVAILDDISRALSVEHSPGIPSSDPTSIASNKNSALQLFTQTTIDSLKQFVNSVNSCAFVTSGGIVDESSAASEPLLIKFLRTARRAYLSAGEGAAAAADDVGFSGSLLHTAGVDPRTSQNSVVGARIIDTDLDVEMDFTIHSGAGVGDAVNATSSGMSGISTFGTQEKGSDLRNSLLQVIEVIGKVMPDATCTALSGLLLEEKDPKVQGDVLLSLCRTISVTTCQYLTVVVSKMQDALPECQQSETMRYVVVTAMDVLFSSLLCSRGVHKGARGQLAPREIGKLPRILPEQLSLDIAELISKIVDVGLLLWPTRAKLVGAISQFIILDPSAAQVLTDKFLVLLRDPEYQVRLHMSRKVAVLFETWDGHDELLQDVCGSFGVKIAKMTVDGGFSGGVALQGQREATMAETALLSLGEIAVASEQIEIDIVFIICAHVAVNLSSRPLACAVLNKMGRHLEYANRWKYVAQILGQVLTLWVVYNVNVSTLLQIKDVLVESSSERDFLQQCCPWVLSWLIYYERVDEIQWLSRTLSLSTAALVKQYFHFIFAAILPLHLGPDNGIQRRADKALQVFMLELADISEDERDALIQKRMVQIVSSLFKFCSAREKPKLPYFPKERTVLAIKTVVDGFLDSDQASQEEGVIDKMEIFRPDRIFKLLLELHFDLFTALHPRHRRNLLTSLGAIIHVLDSRAAVPSTCRYLIQIILQSIESEALQELCCCLLSDLLTKLSSSALESSDEILGEQLQIIVSKLVSCCLSSYSRSALKSRTNKPTRGSTDCPDFSSAFSLLYRLTVEGDPSLQEYIKDLDPFPDLPCFEPIETLRKNLGARRTLAEDLLKFVRRVPNVVSEVRLSSLKNLQDQLLTRKKELYSSSKDHKHHDKKSWRCSALVVDAVWKLVQLCDKEDDPDMKNLAGEFLAAVGVGDPHAVVFHLPDKKFDERTWFLENENGKNTISIDSELGVSEDLLRSIIIQLRSYLIDADVNVIQLASHTLKGLLSTEKGLRAFLSLNQQEKTYLEICFRGVNLKLVTGMVDAAKQKSSDSAIPLDDPTIWRTSGVSYDVWICTLTHSLLEHSEDTILRLCQDILSVKAPLAELVFPHIFGSLAGEYEPGSELCTLISQQVEEHLFKDTNHSTRSLQLFLNTFNSLRQCFIHSEIKSVSPAPKGRESAKLDMSSIVGRKRSKKKLSLEVDENATKSDISTGAPVDDDPFSWNKVYWLKIDYLSTARAAQQCAAYFTSVLYIEHWCEESFGSLTLGPPDFSNDDELPPHLELLLRAYTSINEPDGVYGVVRSHKVTSQLLRYEHEGNWGKALDNYDLLLRTMKPAQSGGRFTKVNKEEESFPSKGGMLPNWQLQKGLMRTLQQKGCSHILEIYRCGISQQESGLKLDAEFKEMQFEAAWRTGRWADVNFRCNSSKHISFDPAIRTTGLCYHEHLHSSLNSLIEGDAETYISTMKMARKEIVTHIAHTSMESTQNVNPLIVKLQILDCVSQAWQMRWNVRHQSNHSAVNVSFESLRSTVDGPLVPSKEQIASFEASWEDNLEQMQDHYELAEPYIAVHKVLLELLDLRDQIPQHLLRLGSFSRKAGRLNHAGAAIYELKAICSEAARTVDVNNENTLQAVLPRHSVAGRVEEAKILWAEGHQEMAVNLAKYVLQLQSQETDSALLLSLTGKWLAETRSSSSRVILDSYLKRAVQLSKSQPGEGTGQQRTIRKCRTHFRLAHYADALYRTHRERLMSTEWQSALRLRQHKIREYELLQERLSSLRTDSQEDKMKIREYSMKLTELHKQLKIDSEEARHLENDRDHFLSIALENYCSCLCISNKYDLRVVFRLISLWFNLSTNENVMDAMLETVEKVESYKFLPLVYQIASRLGSSKEGSKEFQGPNSFQKALTFLLKKMATEHPYHSLYQLFALANGDRIKEKQRGKNVFVVDLEKKRAAEELLGSLTAEHRDLLSQMKRMIEIYIRLAEMETIPKDANRNLPIPREIRNIRQLELIPVVTAPIPVDYSCQYHQDSFPHYKGFTKDIKIMNGINAPKYIECLGSDGNKYRQLAKSGNDDLRQDAVMEQLFGLVNELLQAHPDTQKRNLGVRTYKVVPFTPSAGVLEWVDGTIPLGEYLLGSNRVGGAHARYGGGDWTFLECREHMSTAKDKRTSFENVLNNFRPVMHNFFLEKFSRAEDWFEKRLAYTRSVATSSMVGYIVGLGDRHSLNMLLDQATAEVIHIDLGVAFEQGMMLKTPERIPFRLTRDVVDGMGVTGVEGVFRRCCEATLSVLRTNKEALLTIIEVFIYDPLYNWALSPLKALQRQQELEDLDDSSADTNTIVDMEGNKDAARALFRIKQKLDGYEEGEMRSLQGQVQQLIQDAQDPERLSQLFPGWGAWV